MAFYVSCAAITYIFYTKRGGHLYDIEHGEAVQPAEADVVKTDRGAE